MKTKEDDCQNCGELINKILGKLREKYPDKYSLEYYSWLNKTNTEAIKLTLFEARKEFLKMIEKLAKKEKAVEVNIGEYDKFISVWELEKEFEGK